jgi:hypothetical protein
VRARGDSLGEDPGAEPPGSGAAALADDPAAEDRADLVGAADVQVVGDDLAGEDPPGHRAVQDLAEAELGLQDGDVVAVPGGLVTR